MISRKQTLAKTLLANGALALALAAGAATLTAAPAVAAKKEKAPAGANYSPKVREAAAAAQAAMKAGDTATATAKIAEARAAAQTDDDRYISSALLFDVARTTKNDQQMAEAIDGMIASNKAPAEQLPQLLKAQGQMAYNARDYRKAQGAFERVAQLEPTGENYVLLAETKKQAGDVPGALAAAQRAVDVQKAANRPVPEDWYKRARSIAYEAKNLPETTRWSNAYLAAYPSAENWRTTLSLYRDGAKLDEQQTLDLYRLMRAANALKGERDYFDYANSAFNRGLPGEAAAVIDEGQKANMVPAGSKALGEVKTLASSKVAADRASLAGSETKARAAANGRPAMLTADAYLGYGDYAKAADLYAVALAKGGVDADTVNTRLGIALARSGQKAAALQAFGKVSAGPRQQIAQYWTMWLNQQQG